MNGDWLTLGSVAALALAGATRRGSRALERQVVAQPQQIPLPVDWINDHGNQTSSYVPGWTGPEHLWGGWSRGNGLDGGFRLVQWRIRVDAEGRWSAAAWENAFRDVPTKPYLHLRDESAPGSWQKGLTELIETVSTFVPGFNGPPPRIRTREQSAALSERALAHMRAQERRGRRISGQGYYPDILGPTADLRGWCVDRDDIEIEYEGSRIRHYSCDSQRRHHIQVAEDGEVVGGISLYAKKPWRGLQSATIATVYVDQSHRRQGLASELLHYAREHFRSVKHSKDLTDAGASWKRAVR